MKFRAYKRDDERGYLIQGVAFRNDKEVKENVIGFILERVNYRSYKSADKILNRMMDDLKRRRNDNE